MEARTTLFRVTTPPLLRERRKQFKDTENQSVNQPLRLSTEKALEKDGLERGSRIVRPSFSAGVVRQSTLADQQLAINNNIDIDEARYAKRWDTQKLRESSKTATETSIMNGFHSQASAFQSTLSNEVSSPSKPIRRRKVLSPRTAAIPEPRLNRPHDSSVEIFYFRTGFKQNEILDSALYPPEYKTQFTVTGQTRKVKVKRNGPPLGKKVEVNGKALALFRHNNSFYAIDNKCCHQGGPLHQGDIEDIEEIRTVGGEKKKTLCITCPWHSWHFDLTDGRCLHQEGYSQQMYPCKVEVESGEVMIGFRSFDQDQFKGRLEF